MWLTKSFFFGCVTAASVAASVATVAATGRSAKARFDEITVGRINIVEPDGRLRLVMANRAQFPGAFVEGREIARPDRRDWAGMIFVNDEGTENGGLIQNGRIDREGRLDAGLSLTFDRFRQDQMLQLRLDEDDRGATAGVVVNDQPDHRKFSITQAGRLVEELRTLAPEARAAVRQQQADLGHLGARRAYLGTVDGGTSTLELRDPQGRPRLRLSVDPQGAPIVQWLDGEGRVTRTLGADPSQDRTPR